MYTLRKDAEMFSLISSEGNDVEVVYQSSSFEVIDTMLQAEETVAKLVPELECYVMYDVYGNCSCDEEGDIWIDPNFITELQSLSGTSLQLTLDIILCHELGHAVLLNLDLDASNEEAAWLIGEYLFNKLERDEVELQFFKDFHYNLLASYEANPKYKQWMAEAGEMSTLALDLLKSLEVE